uniref:Uncharacterized protein n=1 Tax=Entomoneis paludosa TaxID=265537 RepID=A0A7S3DRS6_9STRA
MTAAALQPTQALHRGGIPDESQRPSSPADMAQLARENPVFQWLDTCAAGLFGACDGSNRIGHSAIRNEALHALDYSQLHDHFLESLLREAAESDPAQNPENALNTLRSADTEDSDSSVIQSTHRKRRLPKRLRKQEFTKNDENEQPPPKPSTPYDPNAPPPIAPEQFLHDHVRMQKDKGRGEEPGSLICAKGEDACLDKFRAKMRLLCNTAIQEKGASMKRRPARVSVHLDNFVETRSILEVRLGFLSMMYGILLRWDTNITGKITLVVLRKMCHESFYPRAVAAPINTIGSSGSDGSETEELISYSLSKERSAARVIAGDAIIDWPDGTEVTMLEPPFLIPRPDQFRPSRLSVTTLSAIGLDRKSSWTVEFKLDLQQVVSINLTYDHSMAHFVPKASWKGINYDLEALDTALDVSLYQLRSRRRKCIGTMQVPLSNLPVRKDPVTHLSFPCKNARIEMDIFLESESLEWTQNELEARRKASNFFWPHTSSRTMHPSSPPPMIVDTDDEDDEDDSWGWIYCYMC